jgi:hypothetical protein
MNEQQIMEFFNPLFRRFDNMEQLTKNPPLLAHYTSIGTLEKILQINKIWFSNPLFMNDLQEMRFGLNEGREFWRLSDAPRAWPRDTDEPSLSARQLENDPINPLLFQIARIVP